MLNTCLLGLGKCEEQIQATNQIREIGNLTEVCEYEIWRQALAGLVCCAEVLGKTTRSNERLRSLLRLRAARY